MELESKKRIDSLIAAANAKTGVDAADLTEAVQELCNGYGSGGGGDSSLAAAIIERGVKEIHDAKTSAIGAYALKDCGALQTADFPNASSVGDEAFQYCVSLTSVNLPSVKEIKPYAFGTCMYIETLDFPKLAIIGANAFYRCTSLAHLILRNPEGCRLASTNAFTYTPIADGTGYIYVPRDLVESYKTATNWVTYADKFRALEDYTVDGTITGALDESKI